MRERLAGVPPLLVGAAAAAAGEMAAGLLLYTGPGLLRALTLVLSVELVALGVGALWAPRIAGAELVEVVRRRWLFALVAFTGAAAFAGSWDILRGFSASRAGQGLGLGLLAGLPLYATGLLLAGVAALAADRHGRPSATTPWGWAALGGGVGFLVAGFLLVPRVAPASVLLVCVVLLSGGALLHGWILDGRRVSHSVDSAGSAYGEVRVEDRVRGRRDPPMRVILEDGRPRGAEDPGGTPGRAWERAVLEALVGCCPGRVLVLGAGTCTLGRALAARCTGVSVTAVERNAEVVRLARRNLGADHWGALQVREADPFWGAETVNGVFHAVVVDAAGLPREGSLPSLRSPFLEVLRKRLAPGGTTYVGGLVRSAGRGETSLEELIRSARRSFSRVSVHEHILAGEPDDSASASPREVVMVLGTRTSDGRPPPLPELPGFRVLDDRVP